SEEPFFSFKRNIYWEISEWDTLNFIKPETMNENDFSGIFLYLFKERNKLDTIFSSADQDFLFEQFVKIKDTIWQHKLPKAIITDNKNKKRPNRYHYSIPLFSKDKKHVIVKRSYYCGDSCAH